MKLTGSQIQSGCKFHPGFATNLGTISAPIRKKKILAIDPGFVLVVNCAGKGFIV
jgi:hypothetical protein